MTVAGLALDSSNQSPIVLLRDPSGRRQVPIWIDHEQAHNIVAGLKQAKENKPLSHDLMISLLKAGNLQLERVIIHEIEMNTFQAVLKLISKKSTNEKVEKQATNLIEIEARPSDAIALAVRAKCTIWMFEQVVVEASIPVDEDADLKDQNEFKRFLNDIRPADLIRHLEDDDQINDPPLDSTDSDN